MESLESGVYGIPYYPALSCRYATRIHNQPPTSKYISSRIRLVCWEAKVELW
uniref:Uncharacterized protein n=1 Tax=Monilinia fructicola TaxID=38448 RepID=A0A889XPT3_MONFR|nr:hypothetical protein KQ509_mgp01 [Monilinia fructicola]QRF72199.1 hypothetical protein [Monilinia fructicola]